MDQTEELWKDRWDPNAEAKCYTDFDECEMNLLGEFLDGFEMNDYAGIDDDEPITSCTSLSEPSINDILNSSSSASDAETNGKKSAKKARAAPVPPHIKDNRRFYCDAVVNMINASDFVALRSFLNHHVVYPAAFISCWLNRAKGLTNNRYREVTSVDSYIDYITQVSLCVPDGIIEIHDRKLYLNEDNTSILVVKCTYHGLALFEFLCKNAVHSAQQYISKYNPFSYIMKASSIVPEELAEEKFVNEITNRQNMIKNKRKRDLDNSNYISTLFTKSTLSRERKISYDQIEVSQQQTSKFMLGKVRRKPKNVNVTATAIYHINADNLIYRVEVFKRFNINLFGTVDEKNEKCK